MKGLKKKRRIQVMALSGVCVAAVLGLLAVLPEESFQFFRAPSEVAADPPRETELFRIGGLVEVGTLVRGTGTQVAFNVTDGGASIPVVYTGILPDLFEEGQGMVGQGRYINGTFEAIEILARHDEEYMPQEVIDALKEQGTYVEPGAEVATN
ncbi:cytochrome c-type biogenesis protein CcmE [Loktanella sp. DSM 29012]|uniref:Cytochrome c-type biogenesis protein CcmE n=1 Tax=Loktanella gaetbuli TaxID=2881335 RepID=A0ABS8BRA5_9RHOB|nr:MULTISPECIES: cytochrome c maturation protein CcmE [Loktanella]MCB5198264.1 cytochrome c maturation protein CcmE [Loktanella gaetbuli]SEQ70032.1 cytochrome c-type biogenesis protein CcmE [Loktanella sp. DSM 29012]